MNNQKNYTLERFIIEGPFFIALIVQLIQYQWDISLLSKRVPNNLFLVTTAFFLVCSILLRFFLGKNKINYGFKSLTFSFIFILLTGIVYLKSDKSQVIILSLMIVAAYGIDFDKILKCTFIVKGTYFIMTLLAWKMGFIENILYVEDRGIRQSIGFTSYNQGPRELFYLICYYLVIKKLKVTFFELGFIELMSIYMAYETSSRTTLYSITIMTIVIAINKVMDNELFKKIFKTNIWQLSFWVSCAFSAIAIKMYSINPMKYELINKLFTGRLGLSVSALRNYPIKLFGQNIEWVTIGAGQNFTIYNYIDNSYLKMLLDYGTIYSIIIMILLTVVCKLVLKDRNYMLITVLFFVAMRCMIQSELLAFQTNIFILLIAQVLVYLDTKKTPNYDNERKKNATIGYSK